MKNIYTKVYSLKEADDLGHFIMSMGYEGVQNDSYRYCRETMKRAFKENNRHHRDYIYVGVNTYSLVVGRSERWMRKQNCIKCMKDVNTFKKSLTNEYQDFMKRLEKIHKANGWQA